MLLSSRTYPKFCFHFHFSPLIHSIFCTKLLHSNAGFHHLCLNSGFRSKCDEPISNSTPFENNLNRVYAASLSVGTQMWLFYAGLRSSKASFKSFSTKGYPDKPERADDLLNHILCAIENSAHFNREICDDIERLCKSCSISEISYLLQFLHSKHIFLDSNAYNILLAATSKSSDVELSLLVFKDMLVSSKGMSSVSYFNLAKAFLDTDDHSLLLKLVAEVVQMTPHCCVLVLNRMIYAFGECRQIEKALKIFEHMKILECKPDLVTYNTVVRLLGRAGMVDDMLQEFASLKKANINPDIVTYNTLLSNLQKLGRFDLCLVYMREMDENGFIPDLRTYAALIESFGRSGNIEDALRLFRAMKDRQVHPSIYIYRSLIYNTKKMGKLEIAASLLDEMNHSLPNLLVLRKCRTSCKSMWNQSMLRKRNDKVVGLSAATS